MPMLISRSDKIKFLTVSFMENRTKRTRFSLLKTAFNMHHRKGFKVRAIKADGEIEDLVEPFAAPELDVDMNVIARDECAGLIERTIRVVKERARSTHARLSYKKKPKMIIRLIIKHVKKWLNRFPVKNGVSKTLSTRKIIIGKDVK